MVDNTFHKGGNGLSTQGGLSRGRGRSRQVLLYTTCCCHSVMLHQTVLESVRITLDRYSIVFIYCLSSLVICIFIVY